MTDKQIIIDKDKFEKAENEPINQEAVNKFIEDTNKFYIDGVDVSGCDFLAKEDDYCSYSGITYAYKGQCGCSDEEMCKEHPKCFYKKVLKQLKRKEQECEELKAELELFKTSNQTTIDQLKVENEELTTINARLLGRLEVDETDTSLVFNLDKELRQKEKEFYTAIQKVVKLKQTLTEIKEIAEEKAKVNDWLAIDVLKIINEVEDEKNM